MLYKQLITATVAVFLGASQVAALSHGDVEDYEGGKIKWQQVGQGMFSGVPEDEWDDTVHKRSDVDFGLDKFMKRDTVSISEQTRSLELESRNLQGFCQSVVDCVKTEGEVQLFSCVSAFVEAVGLAVDTTQSIWDFLNKPFVATVTGATIAGVATNKIVNGGNPPPKPAECSTSGDQKDALLSALNAAISRDPTAYSVAFDVSGPTTFYTVTVTAVGEGQSIPTPVAGQCFTARSIGRSLLKAIPWIG